MTVIFDSNIIISEGFWFDSTNCKVLLEAINREKIKMLLPEIVFDEVINKFEERLLDSERKVKSELSTFGKLSKIRKENPIELKEIKGIVNEYKEYLIKLFEKYSISIIKYPETSHKELAHKAMKAIKPFNSNEKGYRDSLIWETIKSLVSNDDTAIPQIVFVCKDYKDFATNDYKLHSDLLNELDELGLSHDSVLINPNLKDFNDKQTKIYFLQAEGFRKKLKSKDFEYFDFDLKERITDLLFQYFVGSDLYDYDLTFEFDNSEPTISSIDEDFEIQITDVKKLNATEYLVDVDFEINCGIDFFMDKSEFWYLEEDPSITIEDSDWNKWVMLASKEKTIPLTMSLIIDNKLTITSFQINNLPLE